MLEKTLLNPKNNQNNKIDNKEKQDFSQIQELLDTYPYGYSFEEILNEKYGEENSFQKSELLREYNEYIEKQLRIEENKRIRDYWDELKEKEKNNQILIKKKGYKIEKIITLKPNELKVFDNVKLKMNPEEVIRQRNYLVLNDPNKYHKYKDIPVYWVGVNARKLTKEFLKELGRKDTTSKKVLDKYSPFFKKYFEDNYNLGDITPMEF